jgi:hypothetical protein
VTSWFIPVRCCPLTDWYRLLGEHHESAELLLWFSGLDMLTRAFKLSDNCFRCAAFSTWKSIT